MNVMPRSPADGADAPLDMVIVGAGISGIGMAAHLVRECPGKRFALIERRANLGGTWDLFRYPGIRSDSDMFTLGYEFAPWRHKEAIASGDAILGYLEEVVRDHGIGPHIRFGTSVRSANWDPETGLWAITTENDVGDVSVTAARFLFLASGYYDYDHPHDPAIPGIGDFAGQVVHPQFWPADFDHAGKRVVVIGSGATAVTLVPSLARAASHVTMLQRTPTWMIVRPSTAGLANMLRKVLPEPTVYRLVRAFNTRMQDFLFRRSRDKPEQMAGMLTGQAKKELGEAWSAADFTPPYRPWEQRLCLVPDGDLFKAVRSGQASIVTGSIAGVEADGIRLDDGRHVPADVIVTATGLRMKLGGGVALSVAGQPVDVTQHFFYQSCMLSNVPNFAALFGYLNAGWTLRVDLVAGWLCRLLAEMDRRGATVVTPMLERPEALVENSPLDAFSSGYLQRARGTLPRSAAQAPWQIGMDYRSDRRQMRGETFADGVLRFEALGTHASAS